MAVNELELSGHLLVQDGNHGNDRPRPDEFLSEGTAFIRAADLRGGVIDFRGAGKITDVAVARIRKGRGLPGDVLLSHKGTVGKVAFAREDAPDFVCSPQTTFWRSLNLNYIDNRYLRYFLESPDFTSQLDARKGESDMAPYVSLTEQRKLRIAIPPATVQQAIAEVLGALDDKIAANTNLMETSADLAMALFEQSLTEHSMKKPLVEVTALLSRGITPVYTEELADSMMILNQKCVRGQRVDLGPGRRTRLAKVRSEKILLPEDVVINSTGQGTLGRVARWSGPDEITVDSHITIVRFDGTKVDPTCGGFALMVLQSEIEAMGEGSTGQTELSRIELGKLLVTLPSYESSLALGKQLRSMMEVENAKAAENRTLAATRDVLLPQLMSGKLRVRDAEKAVEAVV